jgi:hypothetical protein
MKLLKLAIPMLTVLILNNCASYYRLHYNHPSTTDHAYIEHECNEVSSGKSNGMLLNLRKHNLYICSSIHSGMQLYFGPFIPFIPAYNPHEWSYEIKWIKLGLKAENSLGFEYKDSIDVTIKRVQYPEDSVIHVVDKFSNLYRAETYSTTSIKNIKLRVYDMKDFWIGIPTKSEFRITIQLEETTDIEILFSPTTGYTFSYLTV